MRYFDHDTGASDDDSIMALRLEHGGAAVDCYWALLEKMYRDEGPINLSETNVETKSVCHRLCVGFDTLEKYVSAMLAFGLFEGTVENLYSTRAMLNITAYQQKCETARQNGKKGGRKPMSKPSRLKDGNQRGNQQSTKSLAIKEKKGIGLDKLNQYQYGDVGAAAANAAPAAPIQCPVCNAQMEATNAYKNGTDERLYRCPLCAEEVYA